MLAARACESELALTAPAIDIGLVRGLSNGRGADVGPATQKTPLFLLIYPHPLCPLSL
jgi:hypothetical protein